MRLATTIGLFLMFSMFSLKAETPSESDYYSITQIPIPTNVVLEVSGLDLMPENALAVATRRGEIYLLKNAYSTPVSNASWTRYAQGLHEPLGLSWRKGWLWATQRGEVTRMKDKDGDGRADLFETVSDDWGISGNYHEYAFGSRHDKQGNLWVVLCLSGSKNADAAFRGWCVRISEDGTMIPTASGIRSPGGIGFNHEGEVFYSDNEGYWNGTSSLKHLKVGSFQGNPAGNKYYELTEEIGPMPPKAESGYISRLHEQSARVEVFVPPAIQMPHGVVGKSTSGFEPDMSNGKFGPFKSQLFVLDQNFSNVLRVHLEKVNGVYQGACFHFLKGFKSGNLVARMSPDGALFVGGTSRGWGSVGPESFALERVDWTGDVPFEVLKMSLTKDGFDLIFTQPVDSKTAGDLASYSLKTHDYLYRARYGSPEVDQTTGTVVSAKVGSDNKSVSLKIDGLKKGHVHTLKMLGVRSHEGLPLLHPEGYYTLNEFVK